MDSCPYNCYGFRMFRKCECGKNPVLHTPQGTILRDKNGAIINGEIIQQDSMGYLVETPQGLMRLPYRW